MSDSQNPARGATPDALELVRPLPLPEDLEQTHDALSSSALLLERIDTPPIDLAPAAAALELSFDRLFATYRRVEDPAESVRAAGAAVDRLLTELAVDSEHPMLAAARESAHNARLSLTHAEERLRAAPWTPPAPPAELRASLRELRLQALERPNLVARVRVAPPVKPEAHATPPELPSPTSFEELDAVVAMLHDRAAKRESSAAPAAEPTPDADREAPSKPAPPPWFVSNSEPVWSRQRFAEDRATNAFDEVLLSWLQRSPIAGERWKSAIFIEQRLLAAIDALLALGPAGIRHLEALTLGNPTRSPAHLSALTLIVGCIDGRDTLALAERLLLEQESVGPEWGVAFASALALVPHADADRVALRLSRSAHPTHRALGTRVLVRRGVLDPDELGRAAEDTPEVATEALAAFALTSRGDAVRDAIERGLENSAEHPALRRAALRALTLSYHPHTTTLLWEDFQKNQSVDAGILLAQYGGRNDATTLLEWVRERPSAAGIEALGWAGLLEAVPVLISALRTRDEAIPGPSAEALERITGAGLKEEVEVRPEQILDPDVPDPVPDDEPKLAKSVSSARDLPEEGAPDRIERASRNPEQWRAWWQTNGSNWDTTRRYRRGHPWSPHVVWMELDRALATPRERRWLRHELVLRTAKRLDFDPEDFVARQELVIAGFESIATAVSRSPGTWSEAQRR